MSSGVQTIKGEDTGENPRRRKQAGGKAGGGEGTWDPIPAKEVDETLFCGAVNGDRVRVKKMFTIVSGPPPLLSELCLDPLGVLFPRSQVLCRGGTVVPLAVAV